MKMNLKPAFRYQFKSLLKSASVFYLICAVVITALIIVTAHFSADSSSYFAGFGISAAIFMFVVGIVNIRGDLRLCLQLGISRRTAFASEILSVLSVSVILAIVGELLTGLAQVVVSGNPNCFVGDLYQVIYFEGARVLPAFSQRIMSALVNLSLFFSSCFVGIFFSLMFWRLNKLWTIVVAIAIPLSINGVPYLFVKLGFNPAPFVKWLISSPINYILTCLAIAALFGIIDWLLLRRANIRAAK